MHRCACSEHRRRLHSGRCPAERCMGRLQFTAKDDLVSGKNKAWKLGTEVSAVRRRERVPASLPNCARERARRIEDSGVYCLVLHLVKARRITVGALGSRRLAAGWYVYTGSAKRNLAARLDRHARREKRIHWHIDTLRAVASIYRIRIRPWGEGVECRTNTLIQALPGATIPWKGFGSSDCRCESHLTVFDEKPEAVLAWFDRFGRETHPIPVSRDFGRPAARCAAPN